MPELDPITEEARDIVLGRNGAVAPDLGTSLSAIILRDLQREGFLARAGLSDLDTLLDERHRVGIATYGISLSDADLTEAEVIQHAREEAADLLKYLIKLAIIRAKKAGTK